MATHDVPYLVAGGTLVTLGEQNRVIDNGALYIEDGRIADLGPTAELRQRHGCPVAIDASNKVVLPGLICAHHHLYSSMARGFAPPGEPAYTFKQILERLWWKLDRALTPEDVRLSASIALAECIRNGTTTILDHHASPSCRDGSLDIIADAVLESGIRASLCYEVSDRNTAGGGVEENDRFLARLAREPSEFLAATVGIHAALTVSDETLARCREVAERHGAGYHIHVAEGPEDPEQARARHGMRTVERLVQQKICGEKSLFIHCINVDEEELGLIHDTGTVVVHNPESNMNNAVGVAPVLEMLKRGILVGLGTDGMSSDMPAQMRCAYLLHRLDNRDPRVAFVEAPTLLLQNNARIAARHFPVRLGALEVGAAADLAIVDYVPPTPMTAENFLGHFIFGMVDATVDSTVVAGRILMQDKRIRSLDVERIAARARELAPQMWQRIHGMS
jgi:putative selenium metabolism protein SsnA